MQLRSQHHPAETHPVTASGDHRDFPLSCEEFARLNKIKPQSVRARICREGSYFGVVPRRLLNGRLAFPDVQVTA